MHVSPRLNAYLRSIFELVVPPRETEVLVRALSHEALTRFAARTNAARGDFIFLLPYRDPRVLALVWELKYHRNPRAVALAAALIAEEALGFFEESLGAPLLLPVPMHPRRRRERGHNQCELLCGAVAQELGGGVEYAPHALARVRLTKPQQGLPRKERLKNVRHSMQADEKAVRGRTCIVIDDVATTGATLAEASRALRNAGAAAVHCLALAGQ